VRTAISCFARPASRTTQRRLATRFAGTCSRPQQGKYRFGPNPGIFTRNNGGIKMKKFSPVKCTLISLLISGLMISPAFGDLYWESVTETKGMPALPKNLPKQVLDQIKSQMPPAEKKMSKHYLSSSVMRSEGEDGIMIIDYESMMMYQINPQDKTYSQTDMRQMAEMMGKNMGMQATSTTVNTGEKKKIGGYDCTKYIQKTDMGETVFWVTKDIDAYKEFETIAEKLKKYMDKDPSLKKMNMGYDFDHKNGWPVQTVSEIMGITTVTTNQNIRKDSFDKDMFEVPKDYTKVASPQAEMMQKMKQQRQ
jgi:hypothetical protein